MTEEIANYECTIPASSQVMKCLELPGVIESDPSRRRDRIILSLWPKHSLFEGKRWDPDDKMKCMNPTLLSLEIGDAELLVAEWSRMPNYFEQEASRSVQAALREHEERVILEDMANAED
jgi:hypothetical protein